MCTYGDGLADVDIDELLEFHRAHGKLATVTTVQPMSRFGVIDLGGGRRCRSGSARSRRPTTGSTSASSSSSRGSSTTWTATSPCSRRSRSLRLADDGQLVRVPARRVLAADGHLPGITAAEQPLEQRKPTLEGVAVTDDVIIPAQRRRR